MKEITLIIEEQPTILDLGNIIVKVKDVLSISVVDIKKKFLRKGYNYTIYFRYIDIFNNIQSMTIKDNKNPDAIFDELKKGMKI